MSKREATVIGAGLAGSEAAWQLAQAGIAVTLYEMRPEKHSPAHKSDDFAELVCSNSLRSDQIENAVGLLKEEMRLLHSLIIECATACRLPAGGALAVDRIGFAHMVTEKINHHPNITVVHQEVTKIPREGNVIVASGPLSSEAIAADMKELLGSEGLYFYDAAAPIVTYDSINMERAFLASRYGKGTADYINCPMTREEYEAFYEALTTAEEAPTKDFEDMKVFEGCMPVEVMAKRGRDTLLYGPMKPVGLTDPHTGSEPYAVVQLRKDNAEGTLYNIVGFQTHLKFPEQRRVFGMIPGLEAANIVRYGVMHRNTFIQSPGVLDFNYRLKKQPNIRFAGQMTGVEGYVESAASGFVAGFNMARSILGKPEVDFTNYTAIGSLGHYISDETVEHFQPMNVNFGIMAPADRHYRIKKQKYYDLAMRGLDILETMIEILKSEEETK